jgi:hypothetical protein
MTTGHQLFREKFDLDFRNYLDGMVSFCLGKPVLDLFKFDRWLHEKYGSYESTGHSMQTLLVEKYGQETADQIQKLLS